MRNKLSASIRLEAQAHHVSGIAKLGQDKYDARIMTLIVMKKCCSENPNTIFLKAVALEGTQNRQKRLRNTIAICKISMRAIS